MTDRQEANRKLAEWLGWQWRPCFTSEEAFSTSEPYWHHPDCTDSKGHKDCGASEMDFWTDPAANLLLLEKMAAIGDGIQIEMWHGIDGKLNVWIQERTYATPALFVKAEDYMAAVASAALAYLEGQE